MIKAIIFDLDGVLVDADKWHYNALNVALQHSDLDPISWQEHLTIYKGIPTRKKLEILTERKGLSQELWGIISKTKQEHTQQMIRDFCHPDPEKQEMMKLLSKKYKIVVCSNAISNSVHEMLVRSGLRSYVDVYLSNEDVEAPKPNPEIYSKAFTLLGLESSECVIVEDSDVGYRAALDSGAYICKVSGPEEVNYYRVLKTILESEQINIVIPAAGQGKRFAEVGYQHPKPLIVIDGFPMLNLVLDNFHYLDLLGRRRNIVLMQDHHITKYCVSDVLNHKQKIVEFVPVNGLTEGAACTVLLAKHLINNNHELVIANSDQFISRAGLIMRFVQDMRDKKADGGILTFKASSSKWSYAKCDEEGLVTEVAEKNPISDQATVGIYYYKHGKDFVKYAEQMIAKNIRTNNEFYVCPVFNEFIADEKRIFTYEIDSGAMYGLGTPEDLELFLEWKATAKEIFTK